MTTLSRILRMLSALIIAFSFSCAPLVSEAQSTGNATINGTIIDVNNQLPISGATVTLFNGTTNVVNATTDTNGAFSFTNQPAGAYSVEITAPGYQGSRSETVFAAAGSNATIRSTLVRARTNSDTQLRTIGRISASSQAGALQTSSTITQQLNADLLQREATLRVGDALQTLPNITSFNIDSAPGDDLNISLRGFRPTDAQALVDGHPVGPIGGLAGLTSTGYNYQLSPSFALQNIQVAYGTGGEALYGTESVAGTVNFQTLNPTSEKQFSLRQGLGNFGRQQTVAIATGEVGRLGYAAEYGVEGTFGGFSAQNNLQNNLLFTPGSTGSPAAGDITTPNAQGNLYAVSGNYIMRQNLLKLRYELTPSTSVTVSGYDTTSYDDKTGEGDNDYVPAEFAGFQFDQNAGQTAGCAGIIVATNAGNSCFNRQQFVNTFTGPAGGGGAAAGFVNPANQTIHLQQYSGQLLSTFGRQTLRVDGFTNAYQVIYNRGASGTTTQYNTYGGTVSDTFQFQNNTFGFGYFTEHQINNVNVNTPGSVTAQPGLISNFGNYFVRDEYSPMAALTLLATGWVKQSSVTKSAAFDPRFSIVGRPSSRDIVRFSIGQAHEDPNISLRASPLTFNLTPTNITNPATPPNITSIATGSNPILQGQHVQDLEFSYGHRFYGDTQIQLVAYNTNEYSPIFSALVPLSVIGIGAGQIPNPPGLGAYLARTGGSIANLGVSTAFNAGSGRYQGLNLTGRYRFLPSFYTDYSASLTSARLYGIPTAVLKRNATLVDGGQIARLPYFNASFGLDYATHGYELRLDNFFTGHNNSLNRPAFYFANATVSKEFGREYLFNVGVSNVFNSQSAQYGEIGLGTYIPENQYGSDANSLAQGTERFGLPPRTFVFSLTKRFFAK